MDDREHVAEYALGALAAILKAEGDKTVRLEEGFVTVLFLKQEDGSFVLTLNSPKDSVN